MNAVKIVEAAQHPAFATDENDRILACNPAARRFLGCEGDLVGRSFDELVAARDVYGNARPGGGAAFHEMVRRGEPIQSFELDVHTASGERARVAVSVVVVLGPEGGYRLVYHLLPQLRRRRADEVIDLLLAQGGAAGLATGPEGRSGTAPRLTPREREILRLLAAGKTAREVSELACVSFHTVRTHTQNILGKLRAGSTVEAVAKAIRQHLI